VSYRAYAGNRQSTRCLPRLRPDPKETRPHRQSLHSRVTSKPSVGHERRLVARPLAVKRTVRYRSSGSTSPVTTERGPRLWVREGVSELTSVSGRRGLDQFGAAGRCAEGPSEERPRGRFDRMNATGAADQRFRRRGGPGAPGQSEMSASVGPSARASRPAGRPHVVVASDGAKVRGGRSVSHRVARVRGPVERRSWRRRRPATHRFFDTDGQTNVHTTHGDHAVRQSDRRITRASVSCDFVHQYEAPRPITLRA